MAGLGETGLTWARNAIAAERRAPDRMDGGSALRGNFWFAAGQDTAAPRANVPIEHFHSMGDIAQSLPPEHLTSALLAGL